MSYNLTKKNYKNSNKRNSANIMKKRKRNKFLLGSGKKGEKNQVDFDQYERDPSDLIFGKKNKIKFLKEEQYYKLQKKKENKRKKKNPNMDGYVSDDGFVVPG